MRKLRNVLYITNPQSYLSREGENIVVSVENKEVGRFPVHNLERIVCFGFMGATPSLMELCTMRDVGLSFASPYGKFLARLGGKISGNVLLRMKQYSVAEDEKLSVVVARYCVLGKLMNCRAVLQRFARDYPMMVSPEFLKNFERLTEGISGIKSRTDFSLNEIRGLEGCYRSVISIVSMI